MNILMIVIGSVLHLIALALAVGSGGCAAKDMNGGSLLGIIFALLLTIAGAICIGAGA